MLVTVCAYNRAHSARSLTRSNSDCVFKATWTPQRVCMKVVPFSFHFRNNTLLHCEGQREPGEDQEGYRQLEGHHRGKWLRPTQ